ncbi:MAG: SDR family NAD(P)-dependent oxidoreductase, partial [Cytophagaceae bacterium]
MDLLKGKVAVITGGSSGIGLATAKRFVEEGAYVFITGRRQGELDKAVEIIGKNVTAIQGDVTKAADLSRIASTVRAEQGVVHAVISNAGVTEQGYIENLTSEHFDKVF